MRTLIVIVLTLLPFVSAAERDAEAAAADRAALSSLLDEFLTRVDERETHDNFWAEELVYTSSSGLRFGKPDIMQGFDDADGSSSGMSYHAEDIEIRLYGDTAVVAFRLVAESEAAESPQYFLNTGTFVRRGDGWKVVAWQATKAAE